MASKLKGFLSGALKAPAVEVLRGYVVKRLKSVSVDDVIKAIDAGDADLYGKLTEKERKKLRTVARRFHKHLDLLTVKNVMQWLIEDYPFLAGVIYGREGGLKWLGRVVENVKSAALSALAESVELVEVQAVEK